MVKSKTCWTMTKIATNEILIVQKNLSFADVGKIGTPTTSCQSCVHAMSNLIHIEA